MPNAQQWVFPPFRLDPANAQLWREDQEITLRRKTFEVLRHLVDHPGQLVTKAALLDAVWAELAVSDSMPAICVGELRKALGDDPQTPRFIETVHGRGYRFIAKVIASALLEVSTKRQVTPEAPAPIIVGREAELAQLRGWFAKACAGTRQIVFVSGEPGIGKTTIVKALLDSVAHDSAARIGRGQCIEQYGSGEPYMPVLEALTRLCQEPGGERAIEVLRKFAPTWLAQMPSLQNDSDRERLALGALGVTQQRMLREMSEALEVLAAEAPVLLAFEDLHWTDFSTLELMSAVARRNEVARLLIIGTYRPVGILASDHPLRATKAELELHQHCEELRLRLLSEEDIATYLGKRFAADAEESFEGAAPIIHARTEGNPLFMVNVVDYLVEQGSILDAGRIEAPRTIRQMIERNLEGLDADEQRVLEAASVAGAEFSAALVGAALERPVNEIETCCASLARHEQFVSACGATSWPDGTVAAGFRFHHALYQEVLYGRVPAGHRGELHRRIAQREEAAYGEGSGDIAAELAHHLWFAGPAADIVKTIRYLQLAGEKAASRSANAEAIGHFRKALQLVETEPETPQRLQQELMLQTALGTALIATQGFSSPEVQKVYARARELSQRTGEATQFFRVLFGLWLSHATRGEYRTALELAEQCLHVGQSSGDSALLLEGHHALGTAFLVTGHFPQALEHLEQTVALYDRQQYASHAQIYGHDPAAVCLIHASQALWLVGRPDQALRKSDESLGLARQLAHPSTSATVAAFAAHVQQMCGNVEAVEELTSSAIEISTEHDFAYYKTVALILRGWASVERKQFALGIAQMESGLDAFRAIGAVLMTAYFSGLLAEAYGKVGRIEDGSKLLAEVDWDLEPWWGAELHRLRGELTIKASSTRVSPRDRRETATECFSRSLSIARAQKAKSLELRAAMSLYRLSRERKARHAEARAVLEGIFASFTEGFDSRDLREAKVLLGN